MPEIPTIEPFQFIRSTAFSERVQLANKLNEVIDALNQIGNIDDLQTQIDVINSEISEIQTAIGNTDTSLAELENQVNALISEVNGLLKEVISEVTLDSPGYGQVRVKVIHEDETETASNVLQIPVIQDGGITLISGTTDRSFKIQYITMDGVTHTTNDFVIPEGGGTDVTITSISILQGDTPNDIKFQVGLSDGSSIQSNSYPIPQAAITPATTSQLGGVKIGAGITVQSDGTISVDLSTYALKTEIPDVSDFVTAEDVAADYQPKGNYLTTVPTASATTLGGVKIGNGVTIADDGTISVAGSGDEWEELDLSNLPTDFAEGDEIEMVLSLDYTFSFVNWTTAPNKPNITSGDKLFYAKLIIRTGDIITYYYPLGVINSGNVGIVIISISRLFEYGAWNNGNLIDLMITSINANSSTSTSTVVTRNNASQYIKSMKRKKATQ